MKFKEAIKKFLSFFIEIDLRKQTIIKTREFKLDVTDMKYVTFANCYVTSMKVSKGQEILVNGAFIENFNPPKFSVIKESILKGQK